MLNLSGCMDWFRLFFSDFVGRFFFFCTVLVCWIVFCVRCCPRSLGIVIDCFSSAGSFFFLQCFWLIVFDRCNVVSRFFFFG